MTDWTDIHGLFASYLGSGKTYRQRWEEEGFNKQEAEEWVKNGFYPKEIYSAKRWKRTLSATEAKAWIKAGCRKNEDWEFATWLKANNYAPNQLTSSLVELRAAYKQDWLAKHYPDRSEN